MGAQAEKDKELFWNSLRLLRFWMPRNQWFELVDAQKACYSITLMVKVLWESYARAMVHGIPVQFTWASTCSRAPAG